jgi:uncharacterized protein (UPF0276 family)
MFDAIKSSNASSPIPVAAGIGLRFPHHRYVLERRPAVAWFEVHSENFFGGGLSRRALLDVRRDYPVSLHGVGLSLGSADGLDERHLARLAELNQAIEPGLVSDHLSWSVIDGRYLGDLLPLPLTEEALQLICRHVEQTQQALRRTILLENPSTYLDLPHSVIPEWEFLAQVARRTGCGLLCDVNNIFVSASNHGWDAASYLRALPADSVQEIHLAGHAVRHLEDGSEIRIDDHGSQVAPEVWQLYQQALVSFGARPTLIEWDTDLPAFEVLADQAVQADRRLRAYTAGAHERAA